MFCDMPLFLQLGLLFLWEKTGAQILKAIGVYIVYFRILSKPVIMLSYSCNRTAAV